MFEKISKRLAIQKHSDRLASSDSIAGYNVASIDVAGESY